MTDIFRTMIVPESAVTLARQIASTVAPTTGDGMWVSEFEDAQGNLHYISTGYISPDWAGLIPLQVWEQVDGAWSMTDSDPGNAALIHGAIAEADPQSSITLADVQAVFDATDVTEQDPWIAIDQLGLSKVDDV